MAVPRLRISNPPGTVVFDSVSASVGCLVAVVAVPGSTTTTRTFPTWPGRSCVAMLLNVIEFVFPFSSINVSTDTALGYPRASWSGGDAGQTYFFAVFIV